MRKNITQNQYAAAVQINNAHGVPAGLIGEAMGVSRQIIQQAAKQNEQQLLRSGEWIAAHRAEQLAAMIDARLSYETIADVFGVTPGTIKRVAQGLGLERPDFWTDERVAMVRALREAGFSLAAIAEFTGWSHFTVAEKIKEAGQ
jgi:AraC-like DNA-binding protein